MALTSGEKDWLEVQFSNLQKQVSALFRDQKEVNDLKVEIAKRPTIGQLLAACVATITVAVGIAALFIN